MNLKEPLIDFLRMPVIAIGLWAYASRAGESIKPMTYDIKFILPKSAESEAFSGRIMELILRSNSKPKEVYSFGLEESQDSTIRIAECPGGVPKGQYSLTLYPFNSPVYGDVYIRVRDFLVDRNGVYAFAPPPMFSIRVLVGKPKNARSRPDYLIITGGPKERDYRMFVILNDIDGHSAGEWRYAVPEKTYKVRGGYHSGQDGFDMGEFRLTARDILNGEIQLPERGAKPNSSGR